MRRSPILANPRSHARRSCPCVTPSLRTTALAVIAALALPAAAIAASPAPPPSAHPTDDHTFPGLATIGAGVAMGFVLITLTTGFAVIRGRPRARSAVQR